MAPFESRSLSKAGESDGRWTALERQDSQQTGRITDPNSLRVHFQFVAIDWFTLRCFRLRPPKSGVQLLSRWVPDGKTDGGSWQTFRCSTYPQSPAKRIEVGRIDRSGFRAGEPPSGYLNYISLERQITGHWAIAHQQHATGCASVSSKQPNLYGTEQFRICSGGIW